MIYYVRRFAVGIVKDFKALFGGVALECISIVNLFAA